MELQHINVKLLVGNPEGMELEPVVPVFHRWIQDRVCEELLLDVADYRHVHAGPGVVLIGHEADYSVDNTDGRLGVRYNRKAVVEGSNQDRLAQATGAALTACRRLEMEPELEGKLRFNGQELEVLFNDRLLVPNRNGTREALSSELRTFFQKLFGGSQYSSQSNPDPRRLFSVSVKTVQVFTLDDLLNNLLS